jgi:tRNA modification GTPase
MMLGDFLEPGQEEPVDRVMAVAMHAPRSYTGEDVVEIHCHGGPAIVTRILDVLRRAGARPAEPGEFTRRAFENGRIDLAQAEAVCDLVRSNTAAAGRMALRQLSGRLSERIEAVRGGLIDVAAEIEARLDFPDEEIEVADRDAMLGRLGEAEAAIERLLRDGARGRLVRDGVRIALIGRPNVGKSSLLNALVGRERALVSPHPGTTRDTIECTIEMRGLAATLVDTAGWRAARDEIERMGIERTESEMASADLLVWILDAGAPLADEDRAIAERIASCAFVVALNKCDLPLKADLALLDVSGGPGLVLTDQSVCRISALRGEGIDDLENRIVACLTGDAGGPAESETPLVSNARHLALLERALEALGRADQGLRGGLPHDLVMVDVREALGALDELLGRRFDEELLDAIFSRFCIGK